MKGTWTFSKLPALVLAVALTGPCSARADMIVINLDTVINGSFKSGDLSSSPYLTAAITDGTHQSVNGVFLTMSAPGLGFAGSGKYEHVNNGDEMHNPAWLFNLSSTSGLTSSSFTLISKSGNNGFTTPTINIGSSSILQAANSGAYFNLGFAFAEGKGSTDGRYGGVEFGKGDSISYFIAGLRSSSFVPAILKNGHPGATYSAAAIDDAGGGLWVAGTSTPAGPSASGGGNPMASPEPSTLFMSLVGLPGLGLAWWRKQRRLAARTRTGGWAAEA
jgi:hypothetical protein